MSPTQTELETRLVSALRAKSVQVPEPTFTFDPDVVPLTLEPPRPQRSRVLLVAGVAAVVVAVVIGLAVALGGGGDAKPATPPPPEPVSQLLIAGLPTLTLQMDDFTTEPGRNEIEFESAGGTHELVFEDPALADVALPSSDRPSRAIVDLAPGRDYTVFCTIPGHRQAGMEAVIHVTAGPSGPSKGPMPTGTLSLSNGTLDQSRIPDYVSVTDIVGAPGYVKELDLYDYQGARIPRGVMTVYGEDLRTVIGHLNQNRGFLPLGQDPATLPIVSSTTSMPDDASTPEPVNP